MGAASGPFAGVATVVVVVVVVVGVVFAAVPIGIFELFVVESAAVFVSHYCLVGVEYRAETKVGVTLIYKQALFVT